MGDIHTQTNPYALSTSWDNNWYRQRKQLKQHDMVSNQDIAQARKVASFYIHNDTNKDIKQTVTDINIGKTLNLHCSQNISSL